MVDNVNTEDVKGEGFSKPSNTSLLPTPASSESDLVAQAYKAAQELRAENDRLTALIQEQKVLEARRLLGGRSEAGTAPVVESPEQKAKREANEWLKKAGLNMSI